MRSALNPTRRPIRTAAAVVGITLVAAACSAEVGSGVLANVSVTDLDFMEVNELEVADDFDVDVVIDPAAAGSMSIVMDDNLLRFFDANVDGNKLTLHFANAARDIDPSVRPSITVTLAHLGQLDTTKDVDGDLTVTGITADQLVIDHDGQGALVIDGVAYLESHND